MEIKNANDDMIVIHPSGYVARHKKEHLQKLKDFIVEEIKKTQEYINSLTKDYNLK